MISKLQEEVTENRKQWTEIKSRDSKKLPEIDNQKGYNIGTNTSLLHYYLLRELGQKTMISTSLTKKGQVTIPKEIREALGLKERDKMIFTLRDGEIMMRPLRGLLLI